MYQSAIRVLFLALIVPAVTGAGDTKMITTFRDKSVTATDFKKIVVAFMIGDAELRRRVEDGLVRRTRRSVAAYSLVPEDKMGDRETLKAHLASNGVDAAIVVRLIDYQKEKVVISGQTMDVAIPSFYDYWDTWGGGMVHTIRTGTYIHEDKLIVADIIVYSVVTGKPIWAGQLKETDPKSLRVALDELVKACSSELRKQKLI